MPPPKNPLQTSKNACIQSLNGLPGVTTQLSNMIQWNNTSLWSTIHDVISANVLSLESSSLRTLREHLLLNEENIKVYSYDFTWLLITRQAKEVFEFLIFCKDIKVYNSQETLSCTAHFLLAALAPIMTSSLLAKPLSEFCAYNTIQCIHVHT